MVPVVTVVTPDHGTPVVRLVTSRTDPDLISPLISDLRIVLRGKGDKNRWNGEKKPKRERDETDYFMLQTQ